MSRAVQERRAPETLEEKCPLKNRRDTCPLGNACECAIRDHWRKLGWFATPPWASRAGAEILKEEDEFAGCSMAIHDPCCGDGIMTRCLGDYFSNVIATDIEPRGPFRGFGSHDFLLADPIKRQVGWVFANPPFHLAQQFVERGLQVAKNGIMILARTSFIESEERAAMFQNHLTVMAPFCERVGMQLGPWNPKCSTATSYAWFVFTRVGPTDHMRLRLIPPGTKARLSKIDDVTRFVVPTEIPLVGMRSSDSG